MAANHFVSSLDEETYIRSAKERFPGVEYMDWLVWLQHIVKPKSYVEVGVETGQSLQLARSPTKAVGIDPELNIIYPQETWVKLFKLPSDDFFVQHDLRKVLGEKSVDMAFIDGLHTFDQALKDFINIEHYSKRKTIVVFHDIFPVTPITANRVRKTKFWLGDTWKVVLILKELRPDLKIITIPTYPSGLTFVTGLNSNSKLLSGQVEKIVEQWMGVEFDSYKGDIDDHLNVVENDFIEVYKWLKVPSFISRFLP